MPLPRPVFAVLALAVFMFLSGCAGSPPEHAKPLSRSVPDLAVVLDCKDCHVKSTIPEIIRTSYAAAAAKAGVSIDDRTQVLLSVKEYTERGWGMRFVSLVAGPLAFMLKDEVKAVATISDKEIVIDYSYRMPFSGIESVAQKIGEMTFEQVIK